MPTAYSYISRNKAWSIFLTLGFIIFLGLLGWIIGRLEDNGFNGLVLALLIASLMTIGAYLGGDRLALTVSRAQGPIAKQHNPYYYNLVENLTIAAGLPMPKLYLIDDPTINAFATGRDPKHASVAVTTGALENLANEELEGVLAHELAHIKNYDIRYLILILVMVNAVTLLARWFFYSGSFGGRRSGRNNAAGALALIGLVLLILSPLIAQLVRFAVSRKRELLADASGALLTRYPAGLAKALEKIKRANTQPLRSANEATAHLFLANPFGQRIGSVQRLFMTHPPIEDRIAALKTMAGERSDNDQETIKTST